MSKKSQERATCIVDAAAHVGDLEATETPELVCSMSSTAGRVSVGPGSPKARVYGKHHLTASDTLKANTAPLTTIYRVRPLSFLNHAYRRLIRSSIDRKVAQ